VKWNVSTPPLSVLSGLKMKALSFIALFFYLGSLFPTAQASAHCSWVDSEPANKQVALSSLAPASHPVKHFSDAQGDADQPVLAGPELVLHLARTSVDRSGIVLYAIDRSYGFLARAPPYPLS
jgi:hypothetical protein